MSIMTESQLSAEQMLGPTLSSSLLTQDVRMNSLDYMKGVQTHLVSTFRQYFDLKLISVIVERGSLL